MLQTPIGVTKVTSMIPTLRPHIDAYIKDRIAVGRMAPTTKATSRSVLNGLAAAHGRRPMNQYGTATIDRWLESIADLQPGTRRMYLSRVKGFSRWLVKKRLIRYDPTLDLDPIQVPRAGDRAFDFDEVGLLLAVAPDLRARAIIWLEVGCGLRRVEVSRLQRGDYHRRSRTLRCVDGKGHHKRDVAVPSEAVGPLEAYLASVPATGGPFIRNLVHPNRGLAPHTIGMLVTGWMYDAGIKERPYDGKSGHALRHTCGSDVFDACHQIEVVAEYLGHANEETARRYTRRTRVEQIRPAIEGRNYGAVA
jgi:integrase/recombinase XerC